MNDPLLSRHSRDSHAAALAAATSEVGRYLDDRATPRSAATPDELAHRTSAVDLDRPLGDLTSADRKSVV